MHRRRASPSLPAPAHHVPSTSRGMLPAQPAPLRRSQPTPHQLYRQRESPWAPTLWSGLRAPSPAWHPSGCVPLLPQHRDMPCAGHVSTTTAQNNLLAPRRFGVPRCLSPHVSGTAAHKERVWLPACLALVTGTRTLPGRLGYHKPIVVGVQTHYNPHCPEQDWLGAASALGTSGSVTHIQHPRRFPAGSSTRCPGLVPAALALSSALAGAGMALPEAGAGGTSQHEHPQLSLPGWGGPGAMHLCGFALGKRVGEDVSTEWERNPLRAALQRRFWWVRGWT